LPHPCQVPVRKRGNPSASRNERAQILRGRG
jgi:hypothetical protein